MSIHKKEAYHHGDLRQQLVNATRQLVEERGADNFSVSEACRCAGVSTAAPYRHFPDRQAMLAAVAEQGMNALAERFEAAIENQPHGTPASIAAIGMAYVEFATQQPGVFRLMFGVAEDNIARAALKEKGTRCFDLIQNEVAVFLGRSEIDDMVRQTMFPLWVFVHGAAFLSIDGKFDIHDMTEHVPSMITAATYRLLGVNAEKEGT